jgi:glycosyltransferase involved in cell wall biosynthesis
MSLREGNDKAMRVAYIIPGSGGSFYCENCLRDSGLTGALRRTGIEVWSVPMYLPLFTGEPAGETPLFYGAIALYLRQRYAFFRRLPAGLDRLLNARIFLSLAARLSGSTRAAGLEEMTLSMLRGAEGAQAAELERLIHWLAGTVRPDIVHLSNALLLGLAPAVKEQLGAAVVCTLQDEHVWIDPMGEESRARAWELLARDARAVDRFTAVSGYYRDFIAPRLGLDPAAVAVVPPGVDPARYACRDRAPSPPVIGFLSRIQEESGLDTLLQALRLVIDDPTLADTRLLVYGGMTGDDGPYVRRIRGMIRKLDLRREVELQTGYDRSRRVEFLSRLSVLCVPRREPEAFGMFLLEAQASGVPVVAPRLGGFAELVEATQGGLLYAPGDVPALADALRHILADRPAALRMGAAGCARAKELYSLERTARLTGDIYGAVATGKGIQ